MLDRENRVSIIKYISFSISILIFIILSLTLYYFYNYVFIYRPNQSVPYDGFVYPFPWKGQEIYISIGDYALILGIVICMIICVIVTNRLYKAM